MVELKGTEKQIKWAEQIRKEKTDVVITEINQYESKLSTYEDEQTKNRVEYRINLDKAVLRAALEIESSSWWIDHRYDTLFSLAQNGTLDYKKYK